MKFNKNKYQILHLKWGNPGCTYGLVNESWRAVLQEGIWGLKEVESESEVCPGSQKDQWYSGVHQVWHCQQGEGRDCPTLLCWCNLNFEQCAVLGIMIQEGFQTIRESSEKGYKDGEGSRVQEVLGVVEVTW